MSKDKLHSYVLVDRSGSMATKWEETISSINAYVKELTIDGYVTVAIFDDHQGTQFDLVRNDVRFKDFMPINAKEFQPRGGTPLYDCLEKIVSMAEKDDNSKTVIVVMTDGQENSSKEITKDTAKYIIKKCKDKDWQVIFLGADFDAFSQASNVGVGQNFTINTSFGNYGNVMRDVAHKSMNYSATGACMEFNDRDRAVAFGKEGVIK